MLDEHARTCLITKVLQCLLPDNHCLTHPGEASVAVLAGIMARQDHGVAGAEAAPRTALQHRAGEVNARDDRIHYSTDLSSLVGP
eukprot:scaffold222415_cov31-Prasinocladus_malaysianus.AAC.1